MKVLSVHSQGLRGKDKRNDVINYLNNLQAGIICLQDTHWIDSDLLSIAQIWNGDCYINGNKTNPRGVAILMKSNFEYTVVSTFSDDLGNLIWVNLALGEFSLKLIYIYGPNIDCPGFYIKLKELIPTCEQDYLLICGDFNLALDPSLDKK